MLSDNLSLNQTRTIFYPDSWPPPLYTFGQRVSFRFALGEVCHGVIDTLYFDSKTREWLYTIAFEWEGLTETECCSERDILS